MNNQFPARGKKPISGIAPSTAPPSRVDGHDENILPEPRHLCPNLVVPDDLEAVFTVRELLSKDRQQIAFSVLDPKGNPVCFVKVNEKNKGAQSCGIHLELLRRDMNAPFAANTSSMEFIAEIRTGMVHDKSGGLPEIYRPTGGVFCSITLAAGNGLSDNASAKCYTLRDQNGKQLVAFHGNFREKAVNGTSASGARMCATQRCKTDIGKVPIVPYYTVKVAPNADAGLILCGLLALDKIEGSTYVE